MRVMIPCLLCLVCVAASAPADESPTRPVPASQPASRPATRPRATIGAPRPATRPAITTRPAISTRPAAVTRPAASRPAAKVDLLALCIGADPQRNNIAFPPPYEVTFDIHVTNLGGKILGPRQALIIKDFTDDLGTALLRRTEFGADRINNNSRLFVSSDLNAAAISVFGQLKPAPNATKIILEGTVRLLVGGDPETTKINNLRLRIGEKFTASGKEFVVSGLREVVPSPRDAAAINSQIQFSSPQDEGVLEFRMFDKSGVKISAVSLPMIDALDRDPIRPRVITCLAKDPPPEISLEIDGLKSVEMVEIPIKIEAPVKSSFYVGEIPNSYDRTIELSKPEKQKGAQ